MKTRFLLLATSVAVVFVSPAFAQDTTTYKVIDNGVTIAPGVTTYSAMPTLNEENGALIMTPGEGEISNGVSDQKSVRDMTPAERKAYWEQLPDAEKQRILTLRQERIKEQTNNGKWTNLTPEQKEAAGTVGGLGQMENGVQAQARARASGQMENGVQAQGRAKAAPGQMENGVQAQARGKGTVSSGTTTSSSTTTSQGSWASDPNLSASQKASIQRGADTWNGMSAEQKKAFVVQHQGQIKARQ